MKKIYFIAIIAMLFITLSPSSVKSQIYEPEGLNMPGDWDSWTNPPTNLVLTNPGQTSGGLLIKNDNVIPTWKTTFSVADAGADIVTGTYEWIFTSGPTTNYYANKWAGVTVNIDQLQNYIKEDGINNFVTLANGKWYTMVWEDIGYTDCRAIFMETSSEPVDIISVSEATDVSENEIVDINFSISGSPSAEESFYVQYTTDAWTTINILNATMSGTSGQVSIPGQAESTVVEYNVISSSISGLSNDGFLQAIRINDNSELNYGYTVGTALPDEISWANLQWPASGTITPESEFIVYGQAFIYNITEQADSLIDLQSWIGYSTDNTNPETWTNWVPAYYLGGVGDNDEYSANLGSFMDTEGTFYYATRFKYLAQDYIYGGYSESGGDIWDGVDNVSGVLTVSNDPNPTVIGWANLQWPANGEIEPEAEFVVYGQAWIDGITTQTDSLTDLESWIGYSTDDTNPNTWTNWMPAYYLGVDGDNDEYTADLGSIMDQEGTYYYATRFKYQDQDFVYGGYSDGGGDFWDGTDFISGVLVVTEDPTPDEISWANLQWPPTGEIVPEGEFIVYGRAYIEDITSQSDSLLDLEAWIGYHSADTDPSSWTNWIPAYYLGEDGDNDEYTSNLGAEIDALGTYYYATRFKYQDQAYVYGGYDEAGGGFWDGIDNVNGILTVTSDPAPDTIGWANLQWPPNGTIEPEQEFLVYSQAWIDGITGTGSATADLESWIGYSSDDTDPSTWTNWLLASFSDVDGNHDEFNLDLGAEMNSTGTYYYATRFKYLDQDYVYGGYSDDGGGFWDGTVNVNGVLTVSDAVIAFPVEFLVTDATGLYSNIQFKGDMTSWNTEDMIQSGQDWSLTIDLFPGTYEWGVLEDDGSPDGIWLVIGDNLVVSVDDQGNVSGTSTYTVTFVGTENLESVIGVYPNPVQDLLWLETKTDMNKEVQVIDVFGKIINTVQINSAKAKLDLSHLSSGVYLLNITDDNHSQLIKIIKQ